MPESTPPYPLVKAVVRGWYAKFLDSLERPITQTKMAKDMDISASAFSNYLNGLSCPASEQIELLTTYFAPLLGKKKESLFRELEKAIKAETPQTPDPAEAIFNSRRRLKVGVAPCGPLGWGGASSGFFSELLRNWSNSVGLQCDIEQVVLEELEEKLCTKGNLDIAAAIPAAPERARRMRFLLTPISIPMNAVYVVDNLKRLGLGADFATDIADYLAEGSRSTRTGVREKIRPLLAKSDMGSIRLRFLPEDHAPKVESQRYDPEVFARFVSDTTQKPYLPLAFVDERRCAEVIQEISGNPNTESLQPVLLFDPERGPSRMPQHRLGIAVSRRHQEWWEFLRRSFALYLRSETKSLANSYSRLWSELREAYWTVFALQSELATTKSLSSCGPDFWLWQLKDELDRRDDWKPIVWGALEDAGLSGELPTSGRPEV